MIAIVDYDIGNINAVANMLLRIGVRSVITSEEELIAQADKIILPGNGSFDACMKSLRNTGLIDVLNHKVLKQRTPVLGICVGAQMLGVSSEEGEGPGLGWIDMKVRKFPALPGLRIPHMGWNNVQLRKKNHPLAPDLTMDARYYFIHSYYMEPADSSDILLSSHYGIDFAAAVAHKNIYGVQFHPEKSHRFGKQLLSTFVNGALNE